jgi:tetratricopeptide (TPR) repeat protein
MAQKITRKSLKQDEFVEAAFDAGEWLERHWRKVAVAAAGVVAVVLAGFAWAAWGAHRRAEASRLLGEGFDLVREAGSAAAAPGGSSRDRYAEAMDRFGQAARKAGRSPLREVAETYRGMVLLRRGDYAEASRVFEEVAGRTSNPALAETATAALAEAAGAATDAERAERLWRQLGESKDGFFPADLALLKLGQLFRERGRTEEARKVLQDLVDRYPQGAAAGEARQVLQRSQ